MLNQLKTDEEFAAFVSEPKAAIVHFYASWAPSCEQTNILLQDLMEDLSLDTRIAFVDAEGLPAVSLKYSITAAPTIIFLNALAEKLNKLINSSRLMLFMKGNPTQPRCGFSKQTIALLEEKNLEYGTFDILSNEEVRQGLKEYSNWPTYPQLYLDGELVGGLDVIREEIADEGFVSKLPVKKNVKSMEDRIKELLNKSRLMLFMKGDRNEPKCGFSSTIVGLLDDARADYETFDILKDEEIRQALKEHSNWPTYPQLYLDGELVGGLDVVKEELLDTHFLRSIPRIRS